MNMPHIESVAHGRAYAYENALRRVTESPLAKILGTLSAGGPPDWLTLEEMREAWAAFDGCRRALEGK